MRTLRQFFFLVGLLLAGVMASTTAFAAACPANDNGEKVLTMTFYTSSQGEPASQALCDGWMQKAAAKGQLMTLSEYALAFWKADCKCTPVYQFYTRLKDDRPAAERGQPMTRDDLCILGARLAGSPRRTCGP